MILRGLYKLIVTAGGIALIATVLSVLQVIQSAWRIADGSPYCIQVAASGENKYKPARTWLDLSILSLWGIESNGYYISHHAILVVDRDRNRQQRFHWSYWRQPGFVPGLRNEEAEGFGSAVACEPVPGFASRLPWIIPKTPDSDYVRFSAHEAYRIPKSYHAHWSGGAAGYWLQLGAPAPEFPALKKSWEDSTQKERVSEWIIINSHATLSAQLVKSINSDPISVPERGIEFGLQKQKMFEGNYSKQGGTYRYFTPVDEGADGPDATLINCRTLSIYDPKSCGQTFINNGRNISFLHRIEDLPNWRDMQKRILELLASFEANGDARAQGIR